MAEEIKNYENIDIPYNTYLSRGDITTPEGSLDSSNGTKEEEIKSGDSLNDLWIRNFIRSENWSPKKKGFSIDGLTGYAEFMNVFISGNIQALTGTIGGFTIATSTISATNLTLTSGAANVANISVGTGSNLAGMNSANGATDIAFWAGDTFANRATAPFKVTAAGVVTATTGTIGGWTISSTTISSATSGERIILDSGNKKISLINSSETEILKFNYNATTTQAIQLINIKDNDKRGIEFIVESTRGSGAKCITIDNPSNSISIDMTDAGSTGINIAGASTSGIVITHSGTGAGIDISGAGSAAGALTIGGGNYPSIDINQNGTATNSFGIRITQDTNALKDGIFIDNNANSHVSRGMYIDRDLAADNQIGVALRLECANTGVGGKACGIDFTGATIQAIMNVAADATDPTGGGGAALGRIPIYVAGVLRYLAYYT